MPGQSSTRSEGFAAFDRADLLARAAAWMEARGGRRKLAKRRGCEQSLFEHMLIEIDVLLQLLPILADQRHYGLRDAAHDILLAAESP
jgi:hypothetical protein